MAAQVAIQLSEKDVIRAHARDELGIDMDDLSSPWSAAGASAVAFVVGAGADRYLKTTFSNAKPLFEKLST